MQPTSSNTTNPPHKKHKAHHHAPRQPSNLSQVYTATDYSSSSPSATATASATATRMSEPDLFSTGSGGPSNTTGGPHTPPHNNLNAAAPGELSPPRSQGGSAINGNASMNTSQVMDAQGGPAAFASNGTGSLFPQQQQQESAYIGGEMLGVIGGAGGVQQGGGEWAAGEWKTKKSQDEIARAWECISDKDWSTREFGDVVLARGQAGRGGGDLRATG